MCINKEKKNVPVIPPLSLCDHWFGSYGPRVPSQDASRAVSQDVSGLYVAVTNRPKTHPMDPIIVY